MVSITLAVPKELKTQMEHFPEINWSVVARKAIQNKIEMLRKFHEFSEQSTITEQDALVLGNKVSKAVAKKHKNDTSHS